jgi:hypothetical protein
MSNHQYTGPQNAAAHQTAGFPFAVTGSGTFTVEFPFVTQWVQVKSTGGAVSVAFTSGGMASNNKFTVASSGSSECYRILVKDLYLAGGNWEVVAGLTGARRVDLWTYVHPEASGSIGPNSGSSSTNFGYYGV